MYGDVKLNLNRRFSELLQNGENSITLTAKKRDLKNDSHNESYINFQGENQSNEKPKAATIPNCTSTMLNFTT